MPIKFRPKNDLIDSGLPWLGEIPRGWKTATIKQCGRFVGGGTPSTEKLEFWGGDIPWVSAKDMKHNRIDDAEDHITDLGLKNSAANTVPPDTLLMVFRSGILKHSIPTAVNTVEVAINQDMRGLLCGPIVKAKYLQYLIEGHQKTLLDIWRKLGATVESLDLKSVEGTYIPLPPIDEQEAIAAFLDEQTGRIDEVIAAKRRLAKSLGDKRVSLINQTVTKGLNPNVDLMDSGLHWLGEIPRGWKTEKIRFVANLLVSNVDKKTIEGENPVRLCNYVDIYKNEKISGEVSFMEATASPEEIKKFKIKVGDVAITKDSESPEDIGVPALIDYEAPDLLYGYHLATLRPKQNVSPAYLMRAIQSKPVSYQFSRSSNGITRFSLLHQPIKNTVLPLPPFDEQKAIAEFLDEQTERIDKAIETVNQSIDLLTQYRTSLITATVTGKVTTN